MVLMAGTLPGLCQVSAPLMSSVVMTHGKQCRTNQRQGSVPMAGLKGTLDWERE